MNTNDNTNTYMETTKLKTVVRLVFVAPLITLVAIIPAALIELVEWSCDAECPTHCFKQLRALWKVKHVAAA